MSLAGLIVLPSFILTLVTFYYLYSYSTPEYYWLVCIPLAIAISSFIIRRGIDEWWYSRRPPRLTEFERNILIKHFPYYAGLPEAAKIEFEKRVFVFRLQKEFQMRGKEKIPGDVHLLVCATAIQLTMGFPYRKEFYPRLGMVVMFLRTFITPEINFQHHAVELNQDLYNCLLLSIETFISGLQKPSSFYNVALYGFAKAWKIEEGITEESMPIENRNELLLKLHIMRGFELGYVFKYTALSDMEVFEMCTEHFFLFPEQMEQELPEIYNYLMNVFKQDPANKESPIIQQFSVASNS